VVTSGRGGARKGAGRAPGPSPAAKKIREKASLGGELPHEFLLRVMRTKVGDEVDGTKIAWDDRLWAAAACINYYAPKLATVNVQSKNEQQVVHMMRVPPTNLAGLSVEELIILEKVFDRWEAAANSGNGDQGMIIDGTAYEETLQ